MPNRSSSKYPIPPPRGQSTRSTITRERSNAPMQPLPEKRQHYDPWAVGREHDAKMGVEATGDEMLPFAVAGAVPAVTKLIPATGRMAMETAKYGAAPAVEGMRRMGEKVAPAIQRTGAKIMDTTNRLMTSKPVMPLQRMVHNADVAADKFSKHPAYKSLSHGPFGTSNELRGSKGGILLTKAAKSAGERHIPGSAGLAIDAATRGVPMAYNTLANSIGKGRPSIPGSFSTGPKF